MWRSRLFWKLFLAYAALIVVTAATFAALVSAHERDQVLSYVRARLRDDAALVRNRVADDLATGRRDALPDLARRLGAETSTRITLIAADGVVLGDTEQDAAVMENHRDRAEVVEARERGEGVVTHVSRTLGIPMMYLALRVGDADRPAGFVRVALPMQAVQDQIAAVQRVVWSIALAVGLATLVVTYWIVARITQPIRSLTAAAESIADGQYGTRVYVANRDEVGLLGETFNRMSADLDRRLRQIREDQETLATVLGGMIEGVVALDAAQRVMFANDAARRLLGFDNGSLQGRPLYELVRHAAVQQAVSDALASDQSRQLEFETAGAARRVIALRASRLPGDPPAGVVLVLQDMTDLRRLETMRRDFVANVSHELKTPLSAIKAYAETLLSGALGDRENNVGFVRQIDEQASRLHALILDLLSLARIESGQEAFQIEPLDLGTLISACVTHHLPNAQAKQIELAAVPPATPICVLADAEGAREVFDNLVDNAIKYTPASGRVTIRVHRDADAGVIEVEDSGIGIPPHEQSRIFERFYRVDKARSRELGGTGLGLSIVKHLVQSFGGSICVTSEVGHGSTFAVRLPLADEPAAGSRR